MVRERKLVRGIWEVGAVDQGEEADQGVCQGRELVKGVFQKIMWILKN